jgi:tRNA(Ile)-lysidine synthase
MSPPLRSALSNRLLQQIRTQNFLHAGDRVAVAVSGGADSVALMHLLLDLRTKLGIVLSVAHFNHKLRGQASDADEKFVANLAAKHGLLFHAAHADVAAKAKRDKANLEDTARRTRYAFFDQLVSEGHATKIAVAHTADDQAETVVAHILRGTGLAGLGGIHPVAGHVVRPLIQLRRAELRIYLRSKKQSWREDATNRDTTKTRARIRKKLIPLLEKSFNPAVVQHLVTLADLAREDESFFDALIRARAATIVKSEQNVASVAVGDLLYPSGTKENSRAFSKRLIRLLIEDLKPRPGQLNARHIQSVLDLAESGENGKSLPLPGGIEVRRESDTLMFHPKAFFPTTSKANREPKEFAYNIDLPTTLPTVDVVLPVPCLARVFRLSLIDWPAKRRETSAIRSVLDRDALRLPLVLRNWRPGDRFRPAGHRNAHKMKRLLNRQRIARWDRDGWPVLTSGGVLAWARGFPVAAEFAASERTRVGILIAEEHLS